MDIISNITGTYLNPSVTTSDILSLLLMVLVLCIYEFAAYRLVSHRAFYDRSFSICIGVLPFFIATIIVCLQSDLMITLGTIGALAILRFRTAVKDPVDMLYLLWSVHTGITCGCRLYEVAVLTSLVVTIVLLVLEHFPHTRMPFLLILHCTPDEQDKLLALIGNNVRSHRIKSRNFTAEGLDLVIEFSAKNPEALVKALREAGTVNFTVTEYDIDDIT